MLGNVFIREEKYLTLAGLQDLKSALLFRLKMETSISSTL